MPLQAEITGPFIVTTSYLRVRFVLLLMVANLSHCELFWRLVFAFEIRSLVLVVNQAQKVRAVIQTFLEG